MPVVGLSAGPWPMTEDKEQLCHAGKAFQDASIKIQLKGQVWCCDYNNLLECPSVQRSEIEVDKEITEAMLSLFMTQSASFSTAAATSR